MSNMLVTGGAGFIGANFVRFWNSRKPDDEIIVLDALTYAGNAATLDGLEGVELIHGDIRDYALVDGLLKARTIDTIVHLDRKRAGWGKSVSVSVDLGCSRLP